MGCSSSKAAGGAGQAASFDAAILEARKKTWNTAQPTDDATSRFDTYSADFDVRYMDRGREHRGFAHIHLNHSGAGYNIRGDCGDVDGDAQITDGFVRFDGVTWWVEQIVVGAERADTGLKTLTEGTFDFARNSFSGTWRASNGLHGNYTKFTGANVAITASPVTATALEPQTLASMLKEDIPMAVAKPF